MGNELSNETHSFYLLSEEKHRDFFLLYHEFFERGTEITSLLAPEMLDLEEDPASLQERENPSLMAKNSLFLVAP
jgi:hypothetical protein